MISTQVASLVLGMLAATALKMPAGAAQTMLETMAPKLFATTETVLDVRNDEDHAKLCSGSPLSYPRTVTLP